MTVSINGTSGLTFNDASTQNTAATGFGFKNRIINGAMVIDQRNAGASVTNTAGNVYSLDRWSGYGDQASKYTMQQATIVPTGFKNSLKVTSSSAYTVGSSEFFIVQQKVEGLNCADLGWGTASAATVTLSFQVYSSLTGTFGGSVLNYDNSRSYPFSYTISSANTWTTISLTVAGDTSGTWLTTTGTGIQIVWGLGAGATVSGTAGAWSSTAYYSATGATSVVGTSGATFYITGVQLEKGSTATSFDYRPYGTEFSLCQRYYQTLSGFIGSALNTTSFVGCIPFNQTMRSAPTGDFSGTASIDPFSGASITPSSEALSFYSISVNSAGFESLNYSGLTANKSYHMLPTSGTATLNAEL